ncbi:MAG: hypothetical protein QM740_20215 [Acidovorax sp.]
MKTKLLGLAAMATILGATVPLAAHAEYVWLQRTGTELTANAGELGKPDKTVALTDPRMVLPDGKSSPMDAKLGVVTQAPASGDVRVTAVRAGGDGVLTYFQARLGRDSTTPVNDLELVPTEPGGSTFKLFFKGRPVVASQVNVDTSAGWRRVLLPGKDGTVSFEPSFPGLYVMEVTAKVNNGSVVFEGKKYEDVRHTATLSFDVAR